jgi:hypothetical protein
MDQQPVPGRLVVDPAAGKAEVQQNSSMWGQRIGWTVSKSTRVRWGTEFVHPTGYRRVQI